VSSKSPIPYSYQPGGSLAATAPSYVVRQADTDLWNALQAGEYCYILHARQMGKSSLRARTMKLLRAEGVASTEVELNGIGSQNITAQQWYGGIIWELTSGFSLSINRRQWMREHNSLSPVQRLKIFIETVLLKQISGKIIVFFDEVDSVIGLDFPTDEFFSLIRYCYDKRASNSDFCRLSFVLLGVSTPSELIQHKLYSTPFNIGKYIELKEFKIDEIMPLARGLETLISSPNLFFEEILLWTGGQPFLTQKLCWLLQQKLEADSDLRPRPPEYHQFIADLVQSQIIENWEAQDEPEHLRTIRDRLLLQDSSSRKRLLEIYKRICKHKSVKAGQNTDHLMLKLSGIVAKKDGHWVIKNKIYQTIFDQDWVQKAWPEATQYPRWKAAALTFGTSAISASLIIGIRLLGLLQPWELKAFDQLMRARPFEGQDPRLLLITITETDVQNQPIQQRGAASLSDYALDQLRRKLDLGQPRVIGLDLYREQAVKPQFTELDAWMRAKQNLITICSYGTPGVPPPPNIERYNYGFNNVLEDQDGILRRYPLAVGAPAPCQNNYAFSWLIASQYLEKEGKEFEVNSDGYLKLGNVAFPPLEESMGGYQTIDATGHQVIINPRVTEKIAETITLGDFLSDTTAPEIVRDRIVIIGTVAPSFNDNHWLTSQSQRFGEVIPLTGSDIQAHLVSQLLSSVLDQRPLIWSWSNWVEAIWIFAWALEGGLIAACFKSGRLFLIVLVISWLSLWWTCWLILLLGGWIPLIPAVLASLFSSGSTHLISRYIAALQLRKLDIEPPISLFNDSRQTKRTVSE